MKVYIQKNSEGTAHEFCSYQVTWQTESFTCAAHNTLTDHTESLGAFINIEIIWVCQACDTTQPEITKQCFNNTLTGNTCQNITCI